MEESFFKDRRKRMKEVEMKNLIKIRRCYLVELENSKFSRRVKIS